MKYVKNIAQNPLQALTLYDWQHISWERSSVTPRMSARSVPTPHPAYCLSDSADINQKRVTGQWNVSMKWYDIEHFKNVKGPLKRLVFFHEITETERQKETNRYTQRDGEGQTERPRQRREERARDRRKGATSIPAVAFLGTWHSRKEACKHREAPTKMKWLRRSARGLVAVVLKLE